MLSPASRTTSAPLRVNKLAHNITSAATNVTQTEAVAGLGGGQHTQPSTAQHSSLVVAQAALLCPLAVVLVAPFLILIRLAPK